MVPAQKTKLVAIRTPQAIVDNASWTCTAVDCRGFDYLTIYVMLGASDIAMVALKVQESDDDGSADAYADVPGLVFGTSNQISGAVSVLPSATDDNKIFAFEINLKGRDRYQKLVATAGDGTTGTFLTAWGDLSRAEEAPKNAAGRGCSQILRS